MNKPNEAALFGLIGNTPLIEVTRLDTGPCRLFLKLESQNPGGSIKDRIGLSIIETAEREGKLKPGGVIIEATAGNTGLGLALVGRIKGYRVVLVVPDKMSTEKVLHLKALGRLDDGQADAVLDGAAGVLRFQLEEQAAGAGVQPGDFDQRGIADQAEQGGLVGFVHKHSSLRNGAGRLCRPRLP